MAMGESKMERDGQLAPNNRWIFILMLLFAAAIYSPCADAYAEDGSIRFIDDICYTTDGQIFLKNGRLVMFDYESALEMPLCMKPDCKHFWKEDFRYDTFEDLLMNTEVCYSKRAARSEGPFLLHGDQMYLFEYTFDIFEERHSFNVWKSSIDGTGVKLFSMGDCFPWNVIPECNSAILRNDDLFFVVHLSPNPYGRASADEQPVGEEVIVYHASVSTGSYQEIMHLRDMHSKISIWDVTSDVLYYWYELTSPYKPSISLEEISSIFAEGFEEKSEIYFRELEEHSCCGIKGINYRTGETVVPDPSIEQLDAKTGRQHQQSIISDGKLFLFLNPEITGSADTEHSTFKVIDLQSGQELRSCKAPLYDPYNGFCPYFLLSEDQVFCYLFAPRGEYSIYNLSKEETIVLPLHNQFSAAQGEQIYDVSAETFQTEFIFFSTENSERSFYLTRSMILAGHYEPIPIESIE